ncbi:Zinc finger, CCHC-type [Melia azedarach]|uniref:Zinc finger, CCHC-type n=1 Tax=Melia azedarach TaxID=155640 RepID=A0ACC1YGV2_MELAZ|nr:Zinc finger, CCHC-type [Melia azedarach]
MNVENENIEPVTELGLALGYSSQCTQRRLNSDSGAGSSNVVLSPLPNIAAGRSSTDNCINEENFIRSHSAFHMRSDTAGTNTSGRTPGSGVAVIPDCGSSHEDRTGTGCYMQNNVVGLSLINGKEEIVNGKGGCIAGPSNIQMTGISEAKETISSSFPVITADNRPDLVQSEPVSGDPTAGGKDVDSGNQTSRMEIVLASGFHHTKECEADDTFMQNLTSPGKRHEESASFLEKERKNKMMVTNPRSIYPPEKLESTSENDLRPLFSKNVHGAASRIVAAESAHEVKNISQPDEETLPKDMTVSGERSPSSSRIRRHRRKGKERALSDGDVNGRMSKEDDDSHESVESCNSTGLFSTGKKRWSFEQQLIVRSKKVKTQIQESPGSTSFMKQDSSFLNWISNMMKGFSKSNIDDAPAPTPTPSLALTLAHPTQGQEIPDQKLIVYNKNQESGCRNVGFQSIFQSLYCPKKKDRETAVDDDYQTELEVINGLCDISGTPLTCHSNNDNLSKQFLLSNERVNESASGEEAGTATQPKLSSANFASSQENSKSAENKNSCNLGTDRGEGGTDSNSSMGKRKMSSTENVDSEPPFKLKTNYSFGHGSDPLESLWITRFAPKTSFPLLNLDNQNQSTGVPLECSTSCQKLVPCFQNPISSSNDLKIGETGPHSDEDPVVVGKQLKNCGAETEASTRFNGIKCHNEQRSICKLNPIAPSSRLKNSGAMASVFAKRLDAFKNIVPSDVTDSAAGENLSSRFFCGRKGHNLRDCSEITDGELEDLLKNINSYDGAEELPCLCIRCFQLNHWAVSCPNASSGDQNQLDRNEFSPIEMQLHRRNEESAKLLDGNKCLAQAASIHNVCDENNSTDLEINHQLNQVASSDRMICSATSVKDYIASGSEEKKLKGTQTTPFGIFIHRHVSEVPRQIFDFIKRLRLSRTDILKWINSRMSLAQLNGFFLRLRMGKWEEGLGGTGYYVACITGAQRESSQQNSKNSISVNVGGIKCLVESQYISNHDFLEDELMAWWSATAKGGGKIPSEEDLRVKVEERKMLGM